jgi:hypothetical protein
MNFKNLRAIVARMEPAKLFRNDDCGIAPRIPRTAAQLTPSQR